MSSIKFSIIPDATLTDTQMFVSQNTYNISAQKYAETREWLPKTVRDIKKYNIAPFLKYAKPKGNILIVGSQTGRDYSIFQKKGFTCIGADSSYGLLSEAIKRNPQGVFIQLDYRYLPFLPESFDAIYSDKLASIPKSDLKDLLNDFRVFLRPKGVIYLSFKIGNGVLVVHDLNGPRYESLFEVDEFEKLVKRVGFDILYAKESDNTDPILPNWYSLVVQKS